MKIQNGRGVALAGLVVILIWLLFARWVPVHVQSVLFVILICLAFAMIGTSWRRWKIVRQDRNIASWRRRVGLLGLIADTLALIPRSQRSYMPSPRSTTCIVRRLLSGYLCRRAWLFRSVASFVEFSRLLEFASRQQWED